MSLRTLGVIIVEQLDPSMSLLEVRSYQPLRVTGLVVKILSCGVLPVQRPAIVFPYEMKQPSSLVLPYCCSS